MLLPFRGVAWYRAFSKGKFLFVVKAVGVVNVKHCLFCLGAATHLLFYLYWINAVLLLRKEKLLTVY